MSGSTVSADLEGGDHNPELIVRKPSAKPTSSTMSASKPSPLVRAMAAVAKAVDLDGQREEQREAQRRVPEDTAAAPVEEVVVGGSASSKPAKAAGKLPVGVWVVLSVLSSTSLILTNKFIMKTYEFSYIYTLTCCHFAAGAAFLNVASRVFGMFEPKSIGLRQNLIVAASAVGSVAAMNLSLQYNSVGTYQMLKLAVVPTVMIMERVAMGKPFPSFPIMASLAVMLVGVACATVTDVSFNLLGLAVGMVAVVTTALFGIWQGSKQREFGISAPQLLCSIAPYQMLLAGMCALAFDFQGIQTHQFYGQEVMLIVASCFIAVMVNMASMSLIGATSAVTYNVVGHAKTCLILLSGFLLVPGPSQTVLELAKHFAGVIVGLFGVFSYSYFKLTLASKAATKTVNQR